MSAANAPTPSTANRELVIIRTIDAPPKTVWRAWTDPDELARWWGPIGFNTTTHTMTFKPGGEWRFIMHGPDGRDYANHIAYDDIVENERIVYSQVGDEEVSAIRFQSTATFEPKGDNKTKLTLRMVFKSAQDRERVIREYGAFRGGVETIGRLAECVGQSRWSTKSMLTIGLPSAQEIALVRTFDAPRHVVFDALTKPAFVKQWLLGPPGWSMPICEIDFRVGGEYRYVWRSDEDGSEMGIRGVYRVISVPDRIIHTERFDEAWYPGDAIVTTTLTEASNQTTLMATIRFDSQKTRDGVLASPMDDGVAASYDRLAEVLSD